MRAAGRWLLRHFEPREGWLPVVLLIGVFAVLNWAVLDAGWVPEDGVIVRTTYLGLAMGVLLARRPVGGRFAWLLLVGWGVVATIFVLSQAWPGWLILGGIDAAATHVRRELILFFVQVNSWLRAVLGGRAAEETIVFAAGLGLSGWLLAAYAGWSSFRQQRPLQGLTLIGMAIVLNNVYGGVPAWPVAVFILLTVLLAADMNFLALLQTWDRRGVDYSDELRRELLAIAVALGFFFVVVGFFIPSIRLQRIREIFYDQPIVQAAEGALQRSFAGVQPPRLGGGGEGGGGILPRSFLLGNAPQLAEAEAFTARLETLDAQPVPADAHATVHWRGGSYDTYTGRGWTLTVDHVDTIPAGEMLPLPPLAAMSTLSQTVRWSGGIAPSTRDTVGRPLQFDETVQAAWREPDDIVRVGGASIVYQALSQVTVATPAQLRAARLADVDPLLLARFTALPEIPDRVVDLAAEVTAGAATPYDQARALEQFLRQYPYTLELTAAPPADRDPVDYFLFELKEGYCDYYASSMVVMARSLGLPARLATGFLLQAPQDGVQTVYQLNAHSWAEVYFAGYGWVEFEPTAGAEPTQRTAVGVYEPLDFQTGSDEFGGESVPPIPVTPPEEPLPGWLALLPILLILGAVAGWLRWRGRAAQRDGILWAYGRLQARADGIGAPARPSQTPAEFHDALANQLGALGRQTPRWQGLAAQVRPDVERLTALYVRRQYSGRPVADPDQGFSLWRRLRRPLWLLRWRHWWRRHRPNRNRRP